MHLKIHRYTVTLGLEKERFTMLEFLLFALLESSANLYSAVWSTLGVTVVEEMRVEDHTEEADEMDADPLEAMADPLEADEMDVITDPLEAALREHHEADDRKKDAEWA